MHRILCLMLACFRALTGEHAPDVLEKQLAMMPGVVGSGLFVSMVTTHCRSPYLDIVAAENEGKSGRLP